MRELLEASGYGSRPKDFDDLIRILDSEIRLITPTDPEGKDGDGESTSPGQAGAEILPTDPRLPGAVAAGLADPQAEGDAAGPGRTAAGGSGGGVERPPGEPATAVAVAVVPDPLVDGEEELDAAAAEDDGGRRAGIMRCGGWSSASCWRSRRSRAWRSEIRGRRAAEGDHAAGLVQRLLEADTAQVPAIVGEMAEYRQWVDPLLREEYDKASGRRSRQATPRQPRPVAGGRHAGRLPLRSAARRRAARSAGDP